MEYRLQQEVGGELRDVLLGEPTPLAVGIYYQYLILLVSLTRPQQNLDITRKIAKTQKKFKFIVFDSSNLKIIDLIYIHLVYPQSPLED